MNRNHIRILQSLANGIDPLTNDYLSEGHICHRSEVVRALFSAVIALERVESFDNLSSEPATEVLPSNAGMLWSSVEDVELSQKFDAGVSVKELSHIHNRTIGAIRSRLVKLGKITFLSNVSSS
jgi:hypothetical protein